MLLRLQSNPSAIGAWRQRVPPSIDTAKLITRARSLTHVKSGISCRASQGPSDVFVLDFDGVVVDSEPEVTASAFEAAALHWPHLFSDSVLDVGDKKSQLREAMRTVRPVLVRGFESMVMLRMLQADPTCPRTLDAILGRWSEELTASLSCWGESADELTQIFEAVRNDWMNNRTESWMALQVPYEGVTQALAATPFPVYIASSKAAHRVSALSAAVLGLDLPPDSPRLFASLLPPEEKKAEALRTIGELPICSGSHTRLHFIDDRLDTLLAVRQVPELAARWNLYLADWGYNTVEERAAALREPGIRTLQLEQFVEMLAPRAGLSVGSPTSGAPTTSSARS